MTVIRRIVLLQLATLLVSVVRAGPASAVVQVGISAQSYSGFGAESLGGALTGQKPESKLWYADGAWWAAMLNPAAGGAHTIYRLSGTTWTDTRVVIDERPSTKEDVLEAGGTLYILSRAAGSAGKNKLRRFTYADGRYGLDSGFPVDVPGTNAETTTLARDGRGVLWVTYEEGGKILVAHSAGGDTQWGTPFVIPVTGAGSVDGDDISSVVGFTDSTGPAVGVMWSNQKDQKDYFAVHRDGAGDTSWTVETALSGTLEADDHLNIKAAEGKIYAVVKTSKTGAADPHIRLLVRAESGKWSKFPVARVDEKKTRPIAILQLDFVTRQIYVFMTIGEGTSARGITYKKASMDGISFGSSSTVFIQGPSGETINNATSTKQNLTTASGIVVMASDGSRYWFNSIAPQNASPRASAQAGGTDEDTPVTLTLSGTDTETCELGFSVTAPAHGSLAPVSGARCASGSPNTDTATVTYTPAASYAGSDSFTFSVNDGSSASTAATVSLTIRPVNDAPVASDSSASTEVSTPVTVPLGASDVDTCELGFQIVAGPASGTLGPITASACTGGTPNRDAATVDYTPNPAFTGSDSFTFLVNDGTADSNTATVTLTVTLPNDPPLAASLSAGTGEDTLVSLTLSGTDTETCELIFTVTAAPAHGTLGATGETPCASGSPNADTATVTYTPAPNYAGDDLFTYVVSDGAKTSESVNVSLTVSPVNDAPVAADASATATTGKPVTVTLSASDVDTCDLGFTILAGPSNGSLGPLTSPPCTAGSPNADVAALAYTSTPGFTGSDSFTYQVSDGAADSNIARATVTVVAGEIVLRASSVAQTPSSTTLTFGAPAGLLAGDVMIASIDSRGNPTITAPGGWTLVRLDINSTTMRKATFWKVATGVEPATYTFALSSAHAASGGILAFGGVDNANPIAASGGQINASSSSITAPTIDTGVANALVVGLFAIATDTTVTPPTGMTERFEVASVAGTSKVTSESATVLQAIAGPTGARVATAPKSAASIGHLVALRPAGS